MTDNQYHPESECPRCGRDTDPEDIIDHMDLGPCCYRCACEHDFPPDTEIL